MSDGGVGRGLRSSLWLLALSVNVLIATIEAECSELDSCAIHLAVARHTDSLLLVQDSSLVAGDARGSLRGCLQRRSRVSTRSRALSLMLLLSSRERCCGGTNGALSRVPRVSSCACGGSGGGWVGVVNNLFKIRLREFVLGRG